MNSKGRSLLGLYGFAMAMAMGSAPLDRNSKSDMPDEDKIRKRALQDITKKHKGQQSFWYGDNVVYAINQKVADKKAKKKGYI